MWKENRIEQSELHCTLLPWLDNFKGLMYSAKTYSPTERICQNWRGRVRLETMDKDAELLKIQVYADYCHTSFTFFSSIIITASVGLLLVALPLLYQGSISWLTYYVWIAIVGIGFSVLLINTLKEYHKDLDKIEDFLKKVEKKEPLPMLNEMRKKQFLNVRKAENL